MDVVYFVLDALDECEQGSLKWLLGKLKQLFASSSQSQKPIFKMIVTSRGRPEVIHEHLSSLRRIRLDEDENVKNDLQVFVSSKIEGLAKTRGDAEDDERERDTTKKGWLWALKPLQVRTQEERRVGKSVDQV